MNEQITLLQALVLGVVEGITEFLPISSTGHLLVASQWIGAANTAGTFEIVIQAGAVLAVLLFYRRELLDRARAFPGEWSARRFWFTLLVAFLPAAVVGLALNDLLDSLLEARGLQARVIAWTLILGGFVLWWVDRSPTRDRSAAPSQVITFRQALLIGLAQCFALVPGVSRSGATIVGGLLVGLSRRQATEFSFYLSIPTLGAATLYTLVKNYDKLVQVGSVGALALGTLVAFITSLLAIGWLLSYVSQNDFRGFALYRVLAGLVILVWAGSALG
ncbi:MAG: undecaprenyl-diphosphate phosphatase [Candidatus Xenobium sp.]|jgi:undecaprenyl-diphosphatase|nr:undecaprenyl-diphosphate phosphatase [Burkholderiales bacterium]